MNNLQNNQDFLFKVTKKHVDKKKVLLASILFSKIEFFVNQSISSFKKLLNDNPKNIEFNFTKKAFLDDTLILRNVIKKLNNKELEFNITVEKKQRQHYDVICKAVIGYQLKEAS
jgi:hypothetical protein